MRRGVNHNLDFCGRVFHIQTEVSGAPPAHLVTHVFLDGRVLRSFRADLARETADDEPATDLAIKRQHRDAAKALLGGHIWRPDGAPAPEPTVEKERRATQVPLVRLLPVAKPDVDTLLAIRRAAIAFASHLDRPVPSIHEVHGHLSHLATPIAVLLSRWTEYFRLEEIAELHLLRDELRRFLARGEAADPGEGRSLWMAFSDVARWLARINDRAEIVAHDRETLTLLRQKYFGAADRPPLIADDDIHKLHSLQGRDRRLDALVGACRTHGLRFQSRGERRPTPELERALEQAGQGLLPSLEPVH